MKTKVFLFLMLMALMCSGAAQAQNIIWVSDNKGATDPSSDQGFVDVLRAEGYTVDFKGEDGVTDLRYWRSLDAGKIAELNAADLIIVSRDTDSGQYDDGTEPTDWNSVTTPLILNCAHIYRSSRWRWMDSTNVGNTTAPLQAVLPSHPIFAGVPLDGSNQVQILTLRSSVGDDNVNANNNYTLIATRSDSDADGVWIAEWGQEGEEGEEFYTASGEFAGGHRMYFPAGWAATDPPGSNSDGEYNLTAEGETLFLNAVAYMLGISGGKLKPSVDAGPDQFIVLPDTQTTLAAEIQDDGDPNGRLNYWWEVVSQPDGSIITDLSPIGESNKITLTIPGDVDPNTSYDVTPTVTVDTVGVYELKLHARDEESDSNDVVKITVFPEGYLGLVAHWKLDEGTDTVAQDAAENFYDPNDAILGFDRLDVPGELISANEGPDPNWIDGPDWQNTNLLNEPNDFLGAIWLDNDFQQYMAIRNLHYDSSSLEECTVTAWIRTGESGDQVIASFDRNEYWRLEVNGNAGGDGQIGWGVMTSTGQVDMGSSTRVDDNEWHHVAGVFDNGTLTIYIDGVEDATASGGSTFGSGTLRYGFIGVGSEASAYDGSRGPENYFHGGIDDVRIYNIALTQQEILDVAGIENTPPTADAGPDLRVIQDVDGNTKLISGAVVTDIPGGPGAYTTTWEVLSGPSAVSFLPDENTDNPTVQFNVGAFGLYHLQITVQDANPAYDPVVDDLYIMYQEKSSYDLLGHWKLDESGTDLNAIDSSGNDFHGVLLGDPNKPEWQPTGGKIDGALKFVNSGDDIDQAVDLSSVPGTDDITIMLWMNADSESKGKPIDKLPDGTVGNGFAIYKRDDSARRIQFRIGSDDERRNVDFAPAYEPGVWVHVACTFDSVDKVGKLYIDGLQKDVETDITQTINNIATPLYFGMTSNTSDPTARFQGLLDHVRIYDRALSPLEVALQCVADEVPMEDCILSIEGAQIAGDISGPEGVPDCYVDVHDLRMLLSEWLNNTGL